MEIARRLVWRLSCISRILCIPTALCVCVVGAYRTKRPALETSIYTTSRKRREVSTSTLPPMSTVFCPLQLPTAITIIIQRPETITGLALSCGFFSPSCPRSLVHSLVLHGPDLASLHISIHLSILTSATYLVYPSILVSNCWSPFPPLSLFLLYLLTLATTIFLVFSLPRSCCCIFVWLRVIPLY